jgi:hypothetical protein
LTDIAHRCRADIERLGQVRYRPSLGIFQQHMCPCQCPGIGFPTSDKAFHFLPFFLA